MLQSRNTQMTDINLEQMKFSCGNQQVVVAFNPPLKSLREARERLVQMDKDTLQALGRSDISISEYISPATKLGHLLNFTQCVLAFLLLPRPANFRPGSLLYDNVLFRVPPFANFNAHFGWIVFLIMLPIHLFEAYSMAKKLGRHGLSLADRVWWIWVGSAFIEGMPSFWRLDGLIGEKRREKDAKKH